MKKEFRYLSLSLSQPSNTRYLYHHQVGEYYCGKNLNQSPLFQVWFEDSIPQYIIKRLVDLDEVEEFKE